MSGTGAARRGGVLVLVLVLVAGMAVVAAVVSARAGAAVQDLETSLGAARARALAMSGVEGIVSQVQRQRSMLLRGGAPELAGSWEMPVDGGRWRGVVRLIARPGETDDGRAEARAQSAAAGLDVNMTPEAMLRAFAALGADGARVLAAERSRGFFGSMGEVESALTSGGSAATSDEVRSGLSMFSADPEVESGLGTAGTTGRSRIDLSALKDDALQRELAGVVGQDAARRLARELAGAMPKTRGELVAAMRRAGIDQESWGTVLDRVRVSSAEVGLGRIDINRAGEAVLAAIPGLGVDSARELASVRETLGDAERRSLAWPVTRGVLTPEQFVRAVDHMTTRSLQWRVWIEAGLADAQDRSVPVSDAVLQWAVRLELVVDASGSAARLAYLGDVTSQASMLTVASMMERPAASARSDAPREEAPAAPRAMGNPGKAAESGRGSARGRWAPMVGVAPAGGSP